MRYLGLPFIATETSGEHNELKSGLEIALAGTYQKIGKVHGVNLSGLYNIIKGDYCAGINLAGILNKINCSETNAYFKGINMGGWINEVEGDSYGVNISGVCNLLNKTQGVNISSVNHMARSNGINIALIYNSSRLGHEGITLAGLCNEFENIGGESAGVSIAGLVNNNNGQTEGLQIAGVFNYARNVKRGNNHLLLQASLLGNYVKYV